MRYSLLFVILGLVGCCRPALFAQDANPGSRAGKFWVDGALGANINDDFALLDIRAGYFVSDRLLVGTGLTFQSIYGTDFFPSSTLAVVSPFARYYFGVGQWRPYAQAQASFLLEGDLDVSGELAAGVEKEVAPGVLANLELTYGINDQLSPDLQLGINFNALLGGGDPRLAAMNQLRKGSWNYGSQPISIGYAQGKNFDLDAFDVTLFPEVAYFLTDRWMLDLGANLIYQNTQFNFNFVANDIEVQESTIALGAGLRRYFATERKFNLFAQAGLRFASISSQRTDVNNGIPSEFNFNQDQLVGNLAVGATVFVNSSTSLDFGVRTSFDLSGNGNSAQPALFAALRFWSKKN